MKYFIKKNIIAILVSVIFFLIISISSFVTTTFYMNDIFVFDAFKIDAVVNEDGSMLIKERITVTFDDDYNGEFWRDIVTDKNNNGEYKNKSSFDSDNFSMRIYDDTGSIILYDSKTGFIDPKSVYDVGYSWNNDRDSYGDLIEFEGYSTEGVCAYSYVPASKYPTRIYEFEYILDGFVTCYNDIAEINNNFFDPVDTTLIKNVEVNIKLPNLANNEGVELFTHKAITSYEKINEDGSINYKIDKIFPGDAIESRVLFPRSSITNPNPNNVINKDGYEYLKGLENKIAKEDSFYMEYGNIVAIIITLALIALFIYAVVGAYKKYDKEYKSDFFNDYYRELPATYEPAVMGYLVNFKDVNRNDLTATLMDLIRKGFIEVDYTNQSLTDENANYLLVYNRNKAQNELNAYEKYTLQWFFDIIGNGSGLLTLDAIERYAKDMNKAETYKKCNDRWNKLVKEEGKKHSFFEEKANGALKSVYSGIISIVLIVGIVGLVFNALIGGYILSLPYLSALLVSMSIIGISYLKSIIRRTKEANEEYVRWIAFKKFLTDFGNMEDYPIPALTIWEHYLVYASAFGIAELVNKQLKMKFNDKELVESQAYRMSNFNYYMYRRMNRIYIHADTSYQKLVAERSSSSSGRSRFGGGSSFGGGGGGARGR